MRDELLHGLIQNIFPDILIYKIYWTTTDTQNHMDESPKIWRLEARHTKDYILQDSIYRQLKNRQTNWSWRSFSVHLGWGGGEGRTWKSSGSALYLVLGADYQICQKLRNWTASFEFYYM